MPPECSRLDEPVSSSEGATVIALVALDDEARSLFVLVTEAEVHVRVLGVTVSRHGFTLR
jgi:hypothetical protein